MRFLFDIGLRKDLTNVEILVLFSHWISLCQVLTSQKKNLTPLVPSCLILDLPVLMQVEGMFTHSLLLIFFITQEVNCLRLLKKFSPSYFEPKSHGRGHDSIDMEQPINLGKRGQATEQLVELPILRQVYDIIDAEGSKGLTITEVSALISFAATGNAFSFLISVFAPDKIYFSIILLYLLFSLSFFFIF